MWELGYGCQLALSQWLCQHRSLLHYDVVVQVLCIISLEQLSHMYHKSHFRESSIISTSKHAPKMRISYDHTSSQHIWLKSTYF